jgi:hypothetical protein
MWGLPFPHTLDSICYLLVFELHWIFLK